MTTKKKPDTRVLTAGGLTLSMEHRILYANSYQAKKVFLRPRPAKLLAYLMDHAGRLVTHEQLAEVSPAPWGSCGQGANRVHVSHLRHKIAEVTDLEPLKTVHGGYMMEA